MRKRATVKAVWDSDLQTLLRSLGILEGLLDGDFRCHICQRAIDLDNLGALFREGSNIRVTCDDTACIRAVTIAEVIPPGG